MIWIPIYNAIAWQELGVGKMKSNALFLVVICIIKSTFAQTLLSPPEDILRASAYSAYQRTYEEYLNLWRDYIRSPEFPPASAIDFQMNRLRLYDDLRADCPTSNFVLHSETDRLSFWETSEINGQTPPANTYPTCSNNIDRFDLRYIKFTLQENDGLANKRKQVIWIQSGMHGGHESSNQMAVLFFVQTLFRNIDDPWVRSLLSKYVFVVFPSVNVNGNFSDSECYPSYTNANNVNLLYNFGYDFLPSSDTLSTQWNSAVVWPDWAIKGRSHANVAKPLSEPEARIVRNVIVKMCHPTFGEGYKLAGLVDWHNNGNDYLWADPNGAMDGATAMYNGFVPEFAKGFSNQYSAMKQFFDREINTRWNTSNIVKDEGSPTSPFRRTLAGNGIVISAMDTITRSSPKLISVNETDIRAFAYGGGTGEYPLRIGNEYFDFSIPSVSGREILLLERRLKQTTAENHATGEEMQYAGIPLLTQRSVKGISTSTVSIDWFTQVFKVNALYLETPALWRFGVKEGQTEANTELMYINFIYGQVAYIQAVIGKELGPTLTEPQEYATNVSTTASFSWHRIPIVSTYHLQVAEDSAFSQLSFNDSTLIDTSYSALQLAERKTFYWRIRALNSAITSGWSLPRSFTTGLGNIVGGIPSSGGALLAAGPFLRWDGNHSDRSYDVQIAPDSVFTDLLFTYYDIRDTLLRIPDQVLENNRQYFWRARAKDPTAQGPWSKAWQFETVNTPPVFSSQPLQRAVEDTLYLYHATASDQDSLFFGDAIRYRIAQGPSWLAIDSLTGLTSGVPRIHDVGDTLIVIEGLDKPGAVTRQSYQLSVIHTNHRPAILSVPTSFAFEDSVYRYKIDATDVDSLMGDVLTYSLMQTPRWLTIDSSSGMITGIPLGIHVGDTTLTVRVQDASGLFDEQTYQLGVRHTNHSPTIISIPPLFAKEDSLYRYAVRATDQDSMLFNDMVTYRLRVGPSWLRIDSVGGVIYGVPAMGNLADSIAVVIQAIDGLGDVAEQEFSIQIAHTNHAPQFLALGDSMNKKTEFTTAIEDVPYAYDAYAMDVDSALFGDVVRYHLLYKPAWVVINSVSGMVAGVPRNGDVDTTYQIICTDGQLSDTLEVGLYVTAVNDPPTVTDLPHIEFEEDSAYSLSLTRYIDDVDNEVTGLTLSLEFVTENPDAASATTFATKGKILQSTRNLSFKDTNRFTRIWTFSSESFLDSLIVQLDPARQELNLRSTRNFFAAHIPLVIVATDSSGLSGRDTMSISVLPINDPPELHAIPTIVFGEDDSVSLSIAGFYPHLTDPDDPDSRHTWEFKNSPNLSASIRGGVVFLCAKRDWFGLDSLRTIATDPTGASDSSYIRVQVLPVNDAPVVTGIPDLSLDEDSNSIIHLNRYVRDVENDTSEIDWSVSVLESAPNLTGRGDYVRGETLNELKGNLVYRKSDHSVLLHPKSSLNSPEDSLLLIIDSVTHVAHITATKNFWDGNLKLVFVATDRGQLSASDTISLNINPVNDRPALLAVNTTFFNEDDSIDVPFSSWFSALSDPDDPDSMHTWTVTSGRYVSAQIHNERVTIRAAANWCGEDTLQIDVADAAGAKDSTNWIITVACVNDRPTIVSTPDTLAFYGKPYRYQIEVSDPDTKYVDSCKYFLNKAPTWLKVDSATGEVTGIPPYISTIQTISMEVEVVDAEGLSFSQVLPIRISSYVGFGLDGLLPDRFEIRQNYPNPFNPSTRIIYGVPINALVRLDVFDILGRSIAVLLDNRQEAGFYGIEWDGTGRYGETLASGIYFYRITCHSATGTVLFSLVKKMMLLH